MNRTTISIIDKEVCSKMHLIETNIPQSCRKKDSNQALSHQFSQYKKQANNLKRKNADSKENKAIANKTLNKSQMKTVTSKVSVMNSSTEVTKRLSVKHKPSKGTIKILNNTKCMLSTKNTDRHTISKETVINDKNKTIKKKIVPTRKAFGITQTLKGISEIRKSTGASICDLKVANTKNIIKQKMNRTKDDIEEVVLTRNTMNNTISNLHEARVIIREGKAPEQLSQIKNILKGTIAYKADTQRLSFNSKKKIENKSTNVENKVKATGNCSMVSTNTVKGRQLQMSYDQKEKKTQRTEFPLTANQTLERYGLKLTTYEKGEILGYKLIYFLGNRNRSANTAPFDDENGDYKAYVGNHISYRYEILDIFGKGSFGQALKCKDHKTGDVIALKIIRSKKQFYKQAQIEIKILKFIKEEDKGNKSNIVRILDSFTFRKHICIVFEALSINLYDFLNVHEFKGFSLDLVRKFAVQILQSLLVLKILSIIHCDLKPENILLKNPTKSGIKLIDFGSSCFANEKFYTYIQSRFYRAPEVMLAISYTTAIDMWSLGCILAELFTGHPIFPGENEQEQMGFIVEVIGLPPTSILDKAQRKDVFFTDSGSLLHNKRIPDSKSLSETIGCNDEGFVDFLSKCFNWVPEERITPEQALLHPWIIRGFPQLAAIQRTTVQTPKSALSIEITSKDKTNDDKPPSAKPRDGVFQKLTQLQAKLKATHKESI